MAHKSFAESKGAVEAAQAAKEHFQYEPAEKMEPCILKEGEYKCVRLMGEILESKDPNDTTSATVIETSWIPTKDKSGNIKMRSIIWSSDPSHPLRKLMKTVKGKYDPSSKTWEGKEDEVGKVWFHPNPVKQTGSCDPQKSILYNVIDRSDDWCKENKHTKVLCWDASVYQDKDGNDVLQPSYGVKPSMWKKAWERCTKKSVHPEDTDFIIRKLPKDERPDNFTVVEVFEPGHSDLEGTKGEGLGSKALLTAEEEAYVKYDFKDVAFVSRPTSCKWLIENFGWYIKEVDKHFNTSYESDFVNWSNKEIAAWKAAHPKAEKKEGEETTEETTTTETEKPIVEETPTPAVTEELPNFEAPKVRTRTPATPVVEEVPSIPDPTEYPAYSQLAKEDLDQIDHIENGKIIWKAGLDIVPCDCGYEMPATVLNCPCCGAKYQ